MEIRISETVREKCPLLALGMMECTVTNSPTSDDLWAEIEDECRRVSTAYNMGDLKKLPGIQPLRQAYKAFGKDPNRYRPSAESLCRRAVRQLPLYRINTLVDIINLVSMRSSFSIGAFDSDKIQGSTLELGVGTFGEPFEGIGRNALNIEGLPVLRDRAGGIGTPTSDHERTKITIDTCHLLVIINAYGGQKGLSETFSLAESLLLRHAQASNICCSVI